jgi:ATP-binding cassette subfamily C protein
MIRQYWKFIGQHKKEMSGFLVASSLAGALEAIGLVSLLPALTKLSEGSADSAFLLLVPLAVLLGAIAARFSSDLFQARLISAIERHLRSELVSQVFFSSWDKVRRVSQGKITSGVISEASQVANGVLGFLNMISTSFLVLLLWIAAFVVNPSLVLVTSIFLAVMAFFLNLRLSKFKLVEKQIREGYLEISEKASNLLVDAKFMRLSSQKGFWFSEILNQTESLSRARRKQIALPATNRAFLEASASVFLISPLAFMTLQGMPIAEGLVFLGIFYRIIPRVQSLQSFVSIAVGQRIWLDEWNSRRLSLGTYSANTWEATTADLRRDFPKGLDVIVSNITLMNDTGPLIQDISLRVGSGEFVVIMGRSGAGKTSLIDAILGLRPAVSGQVLLNGQIVDLLGTDADHLKSISVVTQDVPIFSGTIEQNIYCGYDRDDEWLAKVMEIAQLQDFGKDKNGQVVRDISSKSLSMSGGERQRLGIARALYSKPGLMILDEATNGLDEETEMRLVKAIKNLPSGLTVIAISHRTSLKSLADRALVLSENKLVEDEDD